MRQRKKNAKIFPISSGSMKWNEKKEKKIMHYLWVELHKLRFEPRKKRVLDVYYGPRFRLCWSDRPIKGSIKNALNC